MKNKPPTTKIFLIGIFAHFFIYPLLLVFVLGVIDNDNKLEQSKLLICILGFIGILIALVYAINLKYHYQVQSLQIITSSLIAFMFFLASFELLMKNSINANALILAGVFISLAFIIRSLRNEPLQWEIARRQGRLKKYIDEEDWVYIFQIPNTVEKVFLEMEKENNRKNLLAGLGKLHFLMPAIGMALSRNFPDQIITFIAIVLLFMGSLFISQAKLPLYMRIRTWERERGQLLSLKAP